MLLQDRLDDFPLYPDSSSVNDPNFTKTVLFYLVQIFFHDDFDFPRLERVQIDRVFDRKLMHVNKSA